MNISTTPPLPVSVTTNSKMAETVVSLVNISSDTVNAQAITSKSEPIQPNLQGFSPSVSTIQAPTYQRPTTDGSIKSANQSVTHQENKGSSRSDSEIVTETVGVEDSEQAANEKTFDNELNDYSSNGSNNQSNNDKNQIYSDVELALISDLKIRHDEVNTHEQAHAAVGGQYASSPSYSYQTGPDGVKYAVSGEVSIDTSPIEGDPEATLKKAQQVKAAALAPAQPSSQDIKVAAEADQMATQARSDILAANSPEASSDSTHEDSSTGSASDSSDDNADTQQNMTNSQDIEATVSNNQRKNNSELEDKSQEVATDNIMNARRLHINNVYQNSNISSTPYTSFNVQV